MNGRISAATSTKADEFFRMLKANGVKIAPGNSVAPDLVVKGEVNMGSTDTDDINVALGDKQLVAYYATNEPHGTVPEDAHASEGVPNAEEIHAHLTARLPEYMAPAARTIRARATLEIRIPHWFPTVMPPSPVNLPEFLNTIARHSKLCARDAYL